MNSIIPLICLLVMISASGFGFHLKLKESETSDGQFGYSVVILIHLISASVFTNVILKTP